MTVLGLAVHQFFICTRVDTDGDDMVMNGGAAEEIKDTVPLWMMARGRPDGADISPREVQWLSNHGFNPSIYRLMMAFEGRTWLAAPGMIAAAVALAQHGARVRGRQYAVGWTERE